MFYLSSAVTKEQIVHLYMWWLCYKPLSLLHTFPLPCFAGDSGESVVGPPIHVDSTGEAGGQGLPSSLSPPESAGILEEAGIGGE